MKTGSNPRMRLYHKVDSILHNNELTFLTVARKRRMGVNYVVVADRTPLMTAGEKRTGITRLIEVLENHKDLQWHDHAMSSDTIIIKEVI